MQVGELYRVRSDSVYCDNLKNRPKVQGRVAWVHPQGRFAVLEIGGCVSAITLRN